MLKHRFKQIIKKLLTYTSLHRVVWIFLPKGVYVFNYHRIGEKDNCAFDREVFSCTTDAFEKQCLFIKKHFNVISLDELCVLREQKQEHKKKYAVITFDDGYIDNYQEAFPVLKKYNIPATFYVATNFVGNDLIPWWDEIAYILRKAEGKTYQLPNQKQTYYLKPNEIEAVISRIIYDAKRLDGITVIDVLDDIRSTFLEELSEFNTERHTLFMGWNHLKEMVQNNMKVGSHTLSHQVLSQLTEKEQKHELSQSKAIIEQYLSTSIDSVVYPVGRSHCYTEKTCQLAQSVGYHFAFNNEPGRITLNSNSYDLNRFCIGSDSIIELKLTVLFNL